MSQLTAVRMQDAAVLAALRSFHAWPEALTQSHNVGVWSRGCTETPELKIIVTLVSWLKTNQFRHR